MQYYYLVAGLTEYPFDVEAVVLGGLRVDVPQVKRQIMDELAPDDKRAVELLYTYYDVENIVGYVKGTKLPFNELGNLSREDVALLAGTSVAADGDISTLLPEELAERELALALPGAVRAVMDRFKASAEGTLEPEDFEPLSVDDLERELFLSFYRVCGQEQGGGLFMFGESGGVPEYLKRWTSYDRTVRNIVAAYRGRQLGLAPEVKAAMIVEAEPEIRDMLVGGQVQDFGMKDRFPYMEELLQVLETEDFVERERKMDALRVQMADDLAEQDYFGVGRIMDYLIRLNTLHRWAELDAERGRGDFRELVGALTDAEKIERSVGASKEA